MRRVVLGALAGALVAGAATAPTGHAQPAPTADTASRAKDLYLSAEAAMKDGRYTDAIRDYGASYELSKQPALFYKIAHANELAGKCEVALIYYARYLKEGKPSDAFVETTKARMKACGGDPDRPTGGTPLPPPHEPAGSAAPPPPHEPAPPREPAGSAAPPAERSDVGHSVLGGATQSGGGSGAASETPLRPPSTGHKAAWLLVGTSIGLATIGGVLAYAANASENDIKDLYVSALGQPPVFNDATRKRYNDLIDEGHNYQHLSWLSFGLAGATAIGATILFITSGDDDRPAEHARIVPVVSPTSAGVSVRF